MVIQEKTDGSQFSIRVIDSILTCRSKGQQIVIDQPGMFQRAVDTAMSVAGLLHDGWTYRCEFLGKLRHNAITYARMPAGNLVLYDVETGGQHYLDPASLETEAACLGIDVTPCFFQGVIKAVDLPVYLERESFLGGSKVEGIVIKRYDKFGPDHKPMFGKLVSASFREVHEKAWKGDNLRGKDVVEFLGEKYRSEARWVKAIQHLAEAGQLQNAPQDIGPLLREIPADILKEEKEAIMEALFKWAWPQISRKAVAGFVDWYKERVALPNLGMVDDKVSEEGEKC